MSTIYVGWDDGTYLYHHGIPGMKWGVRRFQNPDGSLTTEGRARYGSSTRTFGKQGYVSRASKNTNLSDDARKANQAYDKKISNQYDKTSVGKSVLKKMLLGDAGEMTYNMARAAGEGRFKSLLRSQFDLNGGRILGAIGSNLVSSLIIGGSTVELAKKFASGDLDIGDEFGKYAARVAVGLAAGGAVNKAVQKRAVKSGTELSVQQKLLRRKATNKR